MLSPAEVVLVRRDPALPGLPVLLDGGSLDEWLGSVLGESVRARRRYLRYKQGTSCVLAVELVTPAGTRPCVVTAYSAGAAAKLHKTLERAGRPALLGVDDVALLVATTPAADRDLPALRALAEPARRERLLRLLLPTRSGAEDGGRDVGSLQDGRLTTLSYKPQRRWVGLLAPPSEPSLVLRAYRPSVAATAAAVIDGLSSGSPRTPRLLGLHRRAGLVAVEYLPGQSLDAPGWAALARRNAIAAAGSALAVLHERTPPRSLTHRPGAETTALRGAVDQVAMLLPDSAGRVRRLSAELTELLGAPSAEPRALHGDFSADQVVIDPDGEVSFIDLDRATLGDPAMDLANAAAAWATEAVLGDAPPAPTGAVSVLHAGYAGVRSLPSSHRIAAHTSALLLRRAVEPFRSCHPDWPAAAGRLLDLAESALCESSERLVAR